MKLLRYGTIGKEKPAMLDAEGKVRCLAAEIDDVNGETIGDETLDRLRAIDPTTLPEVQPERLGSCVTGAGKMICIGLNYSDHAAETGAEVPAEPTIFMKATSSIVGPNDDVVIPRGSKKTDWEVELGFVIGKHAKYVDEANAMEHVAGFFVVNDLSEREFQTERCGQWVKGKSCDTFAPLGPWLVTRDEVADPQNLPMWLEVDGHRFQDGNTKTMVYAVPFIVSYLSQFMSLHPGDVISTGTPPGVGMGQDPQLYLKPGQKIRLGIEGLGEQSQTTVADV